MSKSQSISARPQPQVQSALPLDLSSTREKPSLLPWRNVWPQDVYHVLKNCQPADNPARLQQVVTSMSWSARRQVRDGVRELKKIGRVRIPAEALVEGLARRSPTQLQRDAETLRTHRERFPNGSPMILDHCLTWLQGLDDMDYDKCAKWIERHSLPQDFCTWRDFCRIVPPQRLGAMIDTLERLGLSSDGTCCDMLLLKRMSHADLEALVQHTAAAIPPEITSEAARRGVMRCFLLSCSSGYGQPRVSKPVPVREITEFFTAIGTALPIEGADAVLANGDDVAVAFMRSNDAAHQRCLEALRAVRSGAPAMNPEAQACLDAALTFLKCEFNPKATHATCDGAMAPLLVRTLLALDPLTLRERHMVLNAVDVFTDCPAQSMAAVQELELLASVGRHRLSEIIALTTRLAGTPGDLRRSHDLRQNLRNRIYRPMPLPDLPELMAVIQAAGMGDEATMACLVKLLEEEESPTNDDAEAVIKRARAAIDAAVAQVFESGPRGPGLGARTPWSSHFLSTQTF